MNKRNIKNNDNSKLPSSVKPSKTLTFNIEQKTLIQIIILLILTIFLVGCVAKNDGGIKEVYCRDSSHYTSGWVSAENSQSYWVVDSSGKSMEFSKQQCSIKG